MITHHAALIYTMVLVSAADRSMTDRELTAIGDIVTHLPVFRDYDRKQILNTAKACAELLTEKDGLDQAFALIKRALPQKLRETAYTLACDVAAADSKVTPEEMRLLDMVRHHLDIGRLPAAAIERAARARYAAL